MLPCLLVNVFLPEAGVAYCSLMQSEKGQGVISTSKSMWCPHTALLARSAGERVENDQSFSTLSSNSLQHDSVVEGKWSAVKTALVHTAENVLGRVGRIQPDWFRESLEALQILPVAGIAAYSRCVRTRNMVEFRKFRQARSTARRAIRKAKNDWLQKKASVIEGERFWLKKVWKAIMEMQRGCRGLLPCRAACCPTWE